MFITASLISQYIWSDPVLITSQPTAQIWDQNMFIDRNGTIHIVWNEVYESNLSQIYYSKSDDTGDTWSVPFNVSQSDTSKLARPAVGTDYNGHVYVSYTWNSLGYPILLQKKYDGVAWSEPARLDSNSYQFRNWYLNDNEGRTYHFWNQWTNTKYRYKEKGSQEWSEINNSLKDIWIADIAVDEKNDLLCTGSKMYEIGYDERTIFIKYCKSDDQWKEYAEIYSNYSCGVKICRSENNNIHIAMEVMNPSLVGYKPYYMKYQIADSAWTEPEKISDISNPLSIIFMSSISFYPHIFIQSSQLEGDFTEFIRYDNAWAENDYYFDDVLYIGDPIVKECNDNLFMCFRIYSYENTNYLYIVKTTGVGMDEDNLIVKSISLSQNYPNPFNNSTIIEYKLKELSNVKIIIYNSKGELISNPINCRQEKGCHSFEFKPYELNSEIYFYRLIVNDRIIDTKKMLYLK